MQIKKDFEDFARIKLDGDIEFREKYILDHMYIVDKMVKRVDCEALGLEKEDVYSVATLGLLNAVNKFPYKGMNFNRLAFYTIRKHLDTYVNQNTRKNLSLDEHIIDEKTGFAGARMEMVEADVDVAEIATDNILKDEIRSCKLAKSQKKSICSALDAKNIAKTDTQIANELGITQGAYATNLRLAAKKVREQLLTLEEVNLI